MRKMLALTAFAIVWSVMKAPSAAREAAPTAGGKAEVTFASPPKAAGSDGRFTVSFAVSAATDVEVAVLDSQGRVVRHLAAGMLGPNAPAPLKKDSLSQELTWDGKDDLAKPAEPSRGPFKVRIGLGLRPRFEKMIGDNPGELTSVRGLAVGPKGELFVLHTYGSIHPDDSTAFCAVFSREGKYLRTILPYPGSLAEDKLKGVRRLKLAGGQTVPFIYNGEARSLLPGCGELIVHQPVVASDGRVAFIGHQEVIGTQSRYLSAGVRQVTVINSDGSVPAEGVLRTVLASQSRCGGCLALSPDEKTLYATGLGDGTFAKAKTFHCVFRFGWQDKTPTPFIGAQDTPGAGPDKLNTPNGLAADRQGNLFVADRGNDRVAAFKPDGSFLGEVKVARPDRVCVHPTNGAIYVTAGPEDSRTLFKFDSVKAQAPSAQLKLPLFFKKGSAEEVTMLALDATADPPVIYYAAPRSHWAGGWKVLRIEDKGAAFGEPADINKPFADKGVGSVLMVSMDRFRSRLYIDGKVHDVASGKLEDALGKIIRQTDRISSVGTKAGMGAVGLDGNIYLMGYPAWLRRYGPDLKLLPFAEEVGKSGQFDLADEGSLRLRARGVTADSQGNIYALWQSAEKNASNYLALHSPDGKVRTRKLIDSAMRGIASVRLDYQGNIYLAIGVRPPGQTVPDDFKGLDLGKRWKYQINADEMNWYEMMYGCIAKFGPEGGAITAEPKDGVAMEYGLPGDKVHKVAVKGARWIHFGASPVVSWRQPYPDACDCESISFDVDGFGRSFFPDAVRFRVGVVDGAGNPLGAFGTYDNADAAGRPDSIPLYWPYQVAVGNDRVVYVGDRLNRRVVAVRLDHALEEVVALP